MARFFRQHHKSNACGLKNISKNETKISHRMTLNFAETPAGNPGMKFSDLKEHLISAMQKKKEVAFKKFKESDNIDNERASDEEWDALYGESSTGRCDFPIRDIENIYSTTSSSEFKENMNKPSSQEERNFETAESETKHEIVITSEENKYKASAPSTKMEIGSVKECLGKTGIMDVQLTEIEQIIETQFDDVQACQPRQFIEGKTHNAATAVQNIDKELKCAMENDKELAVPKKSEANSIDNECDPDVLYCGCVSASNSAKTYKRIRKSAEKMTNNFKDSEVKETSDTEEPKIIFEKFWKSESAASSSRPNTEDYINITKKRFDDPHCNEKHVEANNVQNDTLNTASVSVESTYNFDLEYLSSSAIPSYQPGAASSNHSCSVQPLDENSVEVIQSSTNAMTENTQDFNGGTTGSCILDQGERDKFPFNFSHPTETHLWKNYLGSGLYISSIGNAHVELTLKNKCVEVSVKDSPTMLGDVFASQEVTDLCSGPFTTTFEEKNVKDPASTSINDDDSDVVVLERSESEEERAVSSSPSYTDDLPVFIDDNTDSSNTYEFGGPIFTSSPPYRKRFPVFIAKNINASPSHGTENPAVTSSPPYTKDLPVCIDENTDGSPSYRTGSPAVISSPPYTEGSPVFIDENTDGSPSYRTGSPAVISSPPYTEGSPVFIDENTDGLPSYRTGSPAVSSSPPYTEEHTVCGDIIVAPRQVFSDEYRAEEGKFSGESEKDKSVNSVLKRGEEYKGSPVIYSEEEEGKISSDEIEKKYKPGRCASLSEDEYNADEEREIGFKESEDDKSLNSTLPCGRKYNKGPVVHSDEEEEGEISLDEIEKKYKPGSCASLSEDECNADEEREIGFKKSDEEEEGEISFDEIGKEKCKPAGCVSLNEDEYNADEERANVFEKSDEEEEGEISFDEIEKKYKPGSCASLSEDEYNADEERANVFEKSIQDYIDDEAVLSGDDDEDDDEEDMEMDSDAEKECVDSEAIENSEMLRKQIAPMHMKQVLADDDRAVKFLQNKFLNEGDLHSTGARNRKFVWKNNTSTLDENLCEESEDDDSDTEVEEAREMMREKFLHVERTETDNEENFIIDSNKSLNLCVLENTAGPSNVRPAAKRPRSSMLNNEEDAQTKIKKRKVKDEAASGTRAVKNCVFRANDTETENKMLDAKPRSGELDAKRDNQNLDAGDSNDSTCVFNDLQ
ncbi:uncharacterized protein LOC118197107 isoform X3 [Stegodyphus dumicola]|uniref:uncharacterized protein LOC118197107 isoform X3 n=1 Tax=Stegodyphus dumicola TaxID=202533 RepID=UPI0015ADDB8E|nr:uncharacterized protein LOC118197107 isoform X3 [Stegodyphus dumicola]